MKVKFKKFGPLGHVPTKATSGSACYDIYSSIDIKMRPGGTEKIPLDIGFSKKYVCRAYPRSSMSVLPTFLGEGIIDWDYRGNSCIILTNFAASDVDIKIGDKIAQIIFLKPEDVSFDEVEKFDDRTSRGTGGFGSTNKYPFLCFFSAKKNVSIRVF